MKRKHVVFWLFFIFTLLLFFPSIDKISAVELYGQVKYSETKLPAPRIKISIKRKNSPSDSVVIYTNQMGIYSIYLLTGWYIVTCEEISEEIYIPFSKESIIFNILVPDKKGDKIHE